MQIQTMRGGEPCKMGGSMTQAHTSPFRYLHKAYKARDTYQSHFIAEFRVQSSAAITIRTYLFQYFTLSLQTRVLKWTGKTHGKPRNTALRLAA